MGIVSFFSFKNKVVSIYLDIFKCWFLFCSRYFSFSLSFDLNTKVLEMFKIYIIKTSTHQQFGILPKKTMRNQRKNQHWKWNRYNYRKKINVVQLVFSGRRNFEVRFTGFENRSCSYHCRSHSMYVFFAGSILNDYERKRNKIVFIKGKEWVFVDTEYCVGQYFFFQDYQFNFFIYLSGLFSKINQKNPAYHYLQQFLRYQMEIFQEYHGKNTQTFHTHQFRQFIHTKQLRLFFGWKYFFHKFY